MINQKKRKAKSKTLYSTYINWFIVNDKLSYLINNIIIIIVKINLIYHYVHHYHCFDENRFQCNQYIMSY